MAKPMHIDLDHSRDLGHDLGPDFDLDLDFAGKGFIIKALFLWAFSVLLVHFFISACRRFDFLG